MHAASRKCVLFWTRKRPYYGRQRTSDIRGSSLSFFFLPPPSFPSLTFPPLPCGVDAYDPHVIAVEGFTAQSNIIDDRRRIKIFICGQTKINRQPGRAPVGLYEIRQVLGAEPEDPDNERVAVRHGDGREKEYDDQLIPGERDASFVAAEVAVHARRHYNVTLSIVVQRFGRILRTTYSRFLLSNTHRRRRRNCRVESRRRRRRCVLNSQLAHDDC